MQGNDIHKAVIDFLERAGLTEVRTMGEGRRMAVIWQDKYAIPCYLDGNTLVLLNRQHKGDALARYDIYQDSPDSSMVRAIIHSMELLRMYRVKFRNVDLYLCGFNFMNRVEKKDKYPVFAQHRVNVYHDPSYVESIIAAYPQFDLVVD